MDTRFLLGKAIQVHLKEGAAFYFKVTQASRDYISGFDQEGLNLTININDIAFIK